MGDGIGKILPYENETDSKATRCLQRCESQTDSLVLTSSRYPSRVSFQKSPILCYTLKKIVRICQGGDKFRSALLEQHYSNFKCSDIEHINFTLCSVVDFSPDYSMITRNQKLVDFLLQYAQENIVRLTVYIKDPFYTKMKRDEQMTIISFIGNFGGLLGLCLGLSNKNEINV